MLDKRKNLKGRRRPLGAAWRMAAACGIFMAGLGALATPASAQYALTWGDEFTGTAGTAPNLTNWSYQTGNDFGNGELDWATNSLANSYLDGTGNLVIKTIDNGVNANPRYTSAHLQTQGLKNVGPYGQVEARIQTPATTGIGEAFWALGSNYGTVGWPTCGEIDMMESHGTNASQSNGTIHAIGYDYYGITAGYVNGAPLNQAFHVYGMNWMPYHIQFYVDGNVYSDLDVTKLSTYSQWPFNQPIFLINGVGVGGIVAGPPDGTSVFPTYMYTDYVHWNSYTGGVPAAPSALGGTANSNSVALHWTASATAGVTYNVYINTTNSFTAGDLNTLEEYNVSGTSLTAYDLEPGTTYYFQVRAQNKGGESSASNTFQIATSARGNAGPVYINCGGFSIGNYMRDMLTNPLVSSGINVSSNSAPPTYNVAGVSNPAPNNVYDSYRWGNNSYSINNLNANALYTVRLHFCENQFTAVGARVFNAFVNGNPVLKNLDLFASAGLNKVVVYTYTAMSDANGNIEVDIANGPADAAMINAIDVTPNTGANNLPGAPGGVTATAASTNQINLSWNAVAGAGSYNVFRSLSSSFIPSSTTYAETVTGTSVVDNVLYTGTTYYYKVCAVNGTGQGPSSATVNATTQTSGAGVIAGINCGGPANGAFAVDQSFNNGTTNTFAGTTVDESALSGATIPSQTVMQSDREGTFNYSFTNLPVGRPITVTMYFMENYFAAAGSRIFNVTLNGTQVLASFDVFANAGAKNKAIQKSFNTFADANGQVNISFSPTKDNAECSAILLTQGPNPPLPSPSASAANLCSGATMVSWPVSDISVFQYKLFRGTTPGGEGGTPIATFPGTTYDYMDTSVTNGQTYYYKLTATNWTGSTTSAETSAVPNPWPIPGTVYAPNFDKGGEGSAYHSTATSNYGGWYRLNENVAIEQSKDGTAVPYDVSYASSGQWIDYTVNAANAGSYTVSFRVSGYGGGPVHIQNMAGTNLTGEIAIPATNDWQVWTNVTATLNLPAGVQTLRYCEDGGNFNFHYMTFTYNGATLPSTPTGVSATAGNAQVSVSWSASSGATSYNLYRSTTAGGEGTTPYKTGVTSPSVDTGLTNGTTYYYKVAAVNSSGTSALSTEVNGTPSGGGGSGGVSINCGGVAASPFVADVDFTGGSTTSVTNTIDTSLLTGTIPPQAVLQSNRYGTTTYTIPGLTAGSTYPVTLYFAEGYWTAAGKRTFNVTANGTSELTNFDIFAAAGATNKAVQRSFNIAANASGQVVLVFTTVIDNAQVNGIVVGSGTGGTAPAAPTGVSASAGNAQVSVSWTASSGATSYNLYRSTTAGGEGTTPYKTGVTSPSVDTGLTNGTKYYYKVAAVNSFGTSPLSSEVSATPASGVPAAPTGVSATAGNAQVSVSWSASSGATSYNLYRSTTAGGEGTTPYKTNVTSPSVDTGLTNGTTYFYKVAAVNASGTSPLSSEVSGTPQAAGSTLSINCGGAASSPFVADVDFTGGGTVTWTNAVNTSLLTGTVPPQAVLQSDREGVFSYTIPGLVANSSHTVTMYFVEQYFNAAGARVFNIAANGTTVLANVDPYALAGAQFKAVQKSFTTTANASGQIALTFSASADQPKVGGIVVN